MSRWLVCTPSSTSLTFIAQEDSYSVLNAQPASFSSPPIPVLGYQRGLMPGLTFSSSPPRDHPRAGSRATGARGASLASGRRRSARARERVRACCVPLKV